MGSQLAGLPMFFGGYPITPASSILHYLSGLKEYGVTTFQAKTRLRPSPRPSVAPMRASWASPPPPAPALR
jgi:hypothetical protein